ncbi:BCCT family transporter [Eionea flava]
MNNHSTTMSNAEIPAENGEINTVMSVGSGLLAVLFVLLSIVLPDQSKAAYDGINAFITANGWFYVSLMSFMLFLCVWLAMSKAGSIRLGLDSDRPEFSNFSWFSMLFGCVIGIGILFWSIAEPIYHFQSNPWIAEDQKLSVEAAQVAMRVTIFHWGLHGWGLYAVIGLAFAYFSFRKGLPLSIRSSLYPIFGEKINGPIGHIADLLAVFGTVFGIATSLGLGAQQMNTGLNHMLGMEVSSTNQVLIIMVVSIIATLSVLSGLSKGIRILSELNMRLTVVILGLFLVLGPTAYLLGAYATNVGDYLANVVSMGLWVDPKPDGQWQGWWTVFYWGWWIAWAPFCGLFIARISKGRTIREFIVGVLVIPTLLAAFWITVFGNTAMYIELFGAGGITEAVNENTTMALFQTIESMGVGSLIAGIMATICIVMLVTYFVTSADSATLVVCTLITRGNPNSPRNLRVFWSLMIAAVASVLLFSGGLKALQTASIVAALPFSFIIILATYGLLKALSEETKQMKTVQSS